MQPVVICFIVVQGIGAAGISPLVMITIGDLVSLRERAKYQVNKFIITYLPLESRNNNYNDFRN